jgi:hypothetical protein
VLINLGTNDNSWHSHEADEPTFWADYTAEYVTLLRDVRRTYGKRVTMFVGVGTMSDGYRAAAQAAVDQMNAGTHRTPDVVLVDQMVYDDPACEATDRLL